MSSPCQNLNRYVLFPLVVRAIFNPKLQLESNNHPLFYFFAGVTYCQYEDDEFPPENWADSILSNQEGQNPQSDGSINSQMNPFGGNLGEMLKTMDVEQLLTLLGECSFIITAFN